MFSPVPMVARLKPLDYLGLIPHLPRGHCHFEWNAPPALMALHFERECTDACYWICQAPMLIAPLLLAATRITCATWVSRPQNLAHINFVQCRRFSFRALPAPFPMPRFENGI